MQVDFAKNKEQAIMGDFPTLSQINRAYGKTFAAQWLIPQIINLSLFTGARNLDKNQQKELALVIATTYDFLKVSEMMLFFHLFKTGRYGRFYGDVDPMIITCALRDFIRERNNAIGRYEQKARETKEREEAKNAISYEEYLRRKEARGES